MVHAVAQTPRPVAAAGQDRAAASTVHKLLVRNRINRVNYVDRATGEPIRRYEHDHPGSLIRVDVKKLGNIPDGGGWRFVGRQQGDWNRQATPGKPRNKYHNELKRRPPIIPGTARLGYRPERMIKPTAFDATLEVGVDYRWSLG